MSNSLEKTSESKALDAKSNQEIEVTPQMIEAGEMALFMALGASSPGGDDYRETARQVFQAMEAVRLLAIARNQDKP